MDIFIRWVNNNRMTSFSTLFRFPTPERNDFVLSCFRVPTPELDT